MNNLDSKRRHEFIGALALSIIVAWVLIKDPSIINIVVYTDWLLCCVGWVFVALPLVLIIRFGFALFSNVREMLRSPAGSAARNFSYVYIAFLALLMSFCVTYFGVTMAKSKMSEILQALSSGHVSLWVPAGSKGQRRSGYVVATLARDLPRFIHFLEMKTMIALLWCLTVEAGLWIMVAALRIWKFSKAERFPTLH